MAEPTATEQPHDLIASDRVEGTAVFRSNGQRIGHIQRIMIDKRTGHAAYAVMNFGGFLGLGEESYPLPWALLDYNAKLGGYEVNVTDEQLKDAPKLVADSKVDLGDRASDIRMYDYYGITPYWY